MRRDNISVWLQFYFMLWCLKYFLRFLSTLWLHTQKLKGVGFLEPWSGPNLAPFERHGLPTRNSSVEWLPKKIGSKKYRHKHK